MRGWLDRVRRKLGTIRKIIRDKDWSLLFYLTAIDDLFYIRSGIPHPLFDPEYYRSRYLTDSYKKHPFSHFMSSGVANGHKPGPYFDYDIYQEDTGWHVKLGNPLNHYLQYEGRQWPKTGICFDIEWYEDIRPRLYKGNIDPVKHYRLHGAHKGRSPLPLFDPEYYCHSINGGTDCSDDLLAHYLTSGERCNYKPNPWFDPSYYRSRYADAISTLSPLEHYLRQGLAAGLYSAERVEKLSRKPLISIIVPVYNVEPYLLNSCIRSVLYQQYPHWELCLADDGSTLETVREQLELWEKRDQRIKVICNDRNQGISAASNAAAAIATGEYVAFLDNDDAFTPDCLYHIAEAISRTSADIVYTDEDLIDYYDKRLSIFRKPDFNKALLLSHNYITHFMAVSRSLFDICDGFRSQHDGAQDFDLVLRLSELTERVYHIPLILYHWRAAFTSTSVDHGQKSYAHDAGKKALAAHIKREAIDADVEDTDNNFYYRIKRVLPVEPRVSVFIWSDDPCCDLEKFQDIERTTVYDNCEFILVVSQNKSSDLVSGEDGRLSRGRIIRVDGNSGKTRVLSELTGQCESEYLVYLDSSVVDVDKDWLRELTVQAIQPGAGTTCGRFSSLDGDGPSYAVPDLTCHVPPYYLSFLTGCSRHLNGLHCPQSVHFPSWDICMIKKTLYDTLGGFDYLSFPELFGFTDLALRSLYMELRHVYTPDARVVGKIEDSSTFMANYQTQQREKELFQQKWHDVLVKGDPYYNLGVLDENNIDRDVFTKWLTGKS